MLAALLTFALMGASDGAEAGSAKKKHSQRDYGSRPSAKVYRNTSPRDFDETQYYERLSEKIPFGTSAWWRQKQLESPTP
jgi:hypothetical protein